MVVWKRYITENIDFMRLCQFGILRKLIVTYRHLVQFDEKMAQKMVQ